MGCKQFGFADYEQTTVRKRTRRERLVSRPDGSGYTLEAADRCNRGPLPQDQL
jgi:hypothetical protein